MTSFKQPRERNEQYLALLRTLPCVSCPREPCGEAAHVRMASAVHEKRDTGMGAKPSDRYAVPLCRWCHRDGYDAQHKMGERRFWDWRRIDPIKFANELWALREDPEACRLLVLAFRNKTVPTL